MRHERGLDASPPVRYIMEVERRGYSSSHLPSAVDGQPPREAAATRRSSAPAGDGARGRAGRAHFPRRRRQAGSADYDGAHTGAVVGPSPLCQRKRSSMDIIPPIRRAIVASSREGDLVFDPFCGSGTSGVAAKELGRFFVGVEKEEEYAELAGRRIEAAERGRVLRELPDVSAGEIKSVACTSEPTVVCRSHAAAGRPLTNRFAPRLSAMLWTILSLM